MKWAGLAVIALVAGCAAPATPQSAGLSPAPVTPSAPTPAGGSTSISSGTVGFSCRLPVFVDRGQGATGAFIYFPSGTVRPDPAAAKVGSLTRPGRELVGDVYVHYFDRAYSRWLPVTRRAVSPDGAHYAYTDRAVADPQNPPTRATIHVVAVKTGADQAFDGGDWSTPYVVLDYAAEGIYLATDYWSNVGLWLMDPRTGTVARVGDVSNVQGRADTDVFWVGAVNPNDPRPVAGVAPDQLDRLNVVDGSRVAWYYKPGSAVHFVSQDVVGHPIIIVTAGFNQTALFLLPSPGISRLILQSGDGIPSIASPISDSHGVWFGSPDGIYLYSEAEGLQKVSDQPGYPANGCF